MTYNDEELADIVMETNSEADQLQNFHKEILAFLDSMEEPYKEEREKEREKERKKQKKIEWLGSLIVITFFYLIIDIALCVMFWLISPGIDYGEIKILLYLNVIGLPIGTIITRIAFFIWTHPKEY